MIKMWAGRLKNDFVMFSSSRPLWFIRSQLLPFLCPSSDLEIHVFGHILRKKKKKKSQNKRFIVLQTDELYLPTLLLSSIACAWWARRWGCWGSGDCARGSAGLALAHLLVSRPQPCRAQGPWHSPYAFFQTSLPNLGRFLAIPRLCFWYNFWTQKESLASHTAWLRSHQNFKMKINYTSLFSVSVI